MKVLVTWGICAWVGIGAGATVDSVLPAFWVVWAATGLALAALFAAGVAQRRRLSSRSRT